MELRGGAVAQYGPGAGGEDRGHQLPGSTERAIADRVDPSVERHEATASDPHPDRARRDTEAEELRSRDDAVLPLCEPRDRPVNRRGGESGAYSDPNVRFDPHAAEPAPPPRTHGARNVAEVRREAS